MRDKFSRRDFIKTEGVMVVGGMILWMGKIQIAPFDWR